MTNDPHPEHAQPAPGQAARADTDDHDPEWEVTPKMVRAMLDRNEDFLLLDCRGPDETEVQSIPGCTIVPMQALSMHLEEIRAFETKPVIVYCRSGSRSLKVATTLRRLGFGHARSMAGGINRWATDIDPSFTRY